MLTILCIIPNYNKGVKNHEAFYAIGMAYVVSIIEQCGYDVDVLNLNFHDGTGQKEIAEKLQQKRYTIVCVGGHIYDICAIELILSSVRLYDPSIFTILGGRILTDDVELICADLDVDYGVIGDANLTLPALLEKIQLKSDNIISNTVYKQNGNFIKAPLQSNNNFIDAMPYPNIIKCGYEEIFSNQVADNTKIDHYFEKGWRNYSIISSLNCVNGCTFCANTLSPFQKRSEENIIKEIEYAIIHYDANIFTFVTDIFAICWDEIERFCYDFAFLKSKHEKAIGFIVSMRIRGFTSDVAILLKQSGCMGVFFGFDSYDAEVLKSMHKGITPEEIDNAIQICRKTNLYYRGCFIFGDIAETTESYLRTLNYWKKYGRGYIDITPISIMQGSAIMEYCISNMLIKDKISYYKNQSRNQNYTLSSIRISPKMTDSEHKKMLNLIISYSLKYKFFAYCKATKSGPNGLYYVHYKCANCSSPNERNGVTLRFKIISTLVCSNCGAKNTIHRLPNFFVYSTVTIIAFLYRYFGVQTIRIYNLLKNNSR